MITSDVSSLIHIPLVEIFNDPAFNCRGHIAPMDVISLSKDIESHGLQQPVVVMPMKENDSFKKYIYKIISGHRRYVAFQVLRRETIPCSINNSISEADALVMNLGENIHRKNLNILQEANALERLKLSGFSQREVADELKKSTSWVNIRYKLLELPKEIREAAAAGFIKQTHILDLHKLGDYKKQIEAAKAIKGAKVRGEKAPNIKGHKRNMFKKKARDPDDIMFMMNHIVETFGCNNFGTRTLAWAAGEINDLELYRDIDEIAIKSQIPYEIPYALAESS